MVNKPLDKEKYAKLARLAGAEGAVLLRNEDETLPLRRGETVSLFGRIQSNYYKSGTGSGGMVNTGYTTCIPDALINSGAVKINRELAGIYAEWTEKNPFVKGEGWGKEPWSQEEMPLTDEIAARAAEISDIAVVIIGRTAGEDRDNAAEKGSYLLSDIEEDMLAKVTGAFSRVAVVLNTGNIIDMKWVETYKPGAVLYVWHGGQEGGNAAADVLTGAVNPGGRLSDTIAYNAEDYPCSADFGHDTGDIYTEDIYVGYRYFETAAREKVQYPFGFGLSYTQFEINADLSILGGMSAGAALSVRTHIRNTGGVPGKETVQVYVSAPPGNLGKPSRVLAAFSKTDTLEPGGEQNIVLNIPFARFSSYDDSGLSGHRFCYVLEAGEYTVYAGANVRGAEKCGAFTLEKTLVIEELESALAPVRPFKRLKPQLTNGVYSMTQEETPLRGYDITERITANLPSAPEYAGDSAISFADVYHGRASLDDFIAQIPNDTLACLVRGEGMSSPKVTKGAAGAFGGLTEELKALGIPAACCADGPSGLRFDGGANAFSMPNGTCLACTWNTELLSDLFEMTALEMLANEVDLILGPGVNIHRSPLCGRNFEYFSEDPYLTGSMAAAELRGLHRHGVSGTIKHFTANNQEHRRFGFDSVISERALREIYLKGYEIAVREAGLRSVMTTYGKVNGTYTAGSYDLTTTILRREWGFDGIAMTDWWASSAEDEKGEPSRTDRAAMLRAQNDLQMVTQDTKAENGNDNILSSLQSGGLTRAELHRCAANILKLILRLPAGKRMCGDK